MISIFNQFNYRYEVILRCFFFPVADASKIDQYDMFHEVFLKLFLYSHVSDVGISSKFVSNHSFSTLLCITCSLRIKNSNSLKTWRLLWAKKNINYSNKIVSSRTIFLLCFTGPNCHSLLPFLRNEVKWLKRTFFSPFGIEILLTSIENQSA